ncbi:hypothetical protein EIN_418510 [Entamoeba invadens IP1]|uniref:Uncharacterized protein n=1 Tax=Entamoeba invadens IP1 TaxID=370355 RepID=A0A0A1U520_ENTIV|nr:hypothetical protein EIN_418510 [Entamoeba invadens IP1]ELP87972.1 hypothetical protein EIN_418510 [Entamoeba invadens IP1]|eukprot:XP_004254743.1 hypothetical protein EIN_418510 [Entamoeba invadens IP1]
MDKHNMFVYITKEKYEKLKDSEEVKLGVFHSFKCSTCIACVSLDGAFVTPAIVLPNEKYYSDLEADCHGWLLYYTKTGFVDETIIQLWLVNHLIPHIEMTRRLLN